MATIQEVLMSIYNLVGRRRRHALMKCKVRVSADRLGSSGIKAAALYCEASPHKRELKCDTKHQSQEADATFITSDGS